MSGDSDRFQSELKCDFSAWIAVLSDVLIETGASEQQAHRQAQATTERIRGALINGRISRDSTD